MKLLVIVLVLVVVVVLGLLGVIILRGGRRGYQRYSGLERQRSSAKEFREVGADRLKGAERLLVEAQRALSSRHLYEDMQDVDRLRLSIDTLADRLRHATYGYSPLGADHPTREAELMELQSRDADLNDECQQILELCEIVNRAATDEREIDLSFLQTALGNLRIEVERRK